MPEKTWRNGNDEKMKIVRLYHQNRKKVWFGLIIVIFGIAMINLINQAYQEQAKVNMQQMAQKIENNKEEEKSSDKTIDYEKASTSLTTGEKVHNSVKDEIQEVLKQFVECVCHGKIQEAYSYLTRECKQEQYPAVEIFAQSYCADVQDKVYDFQLWTTGNNLYVYRVKFLDDLLSTGRDTSKNYFQDYITVLKQDNLYRLNINKLIQVKQFDKTVESNDIIFRLNKVETYLDYEIYEVQVTNHTNKEIILDPREKDDSVYVENSDGLKISSLLYENKEEDLQVASKETKTIQIKFNNTFNGTKSIRCVGFSNIIINQKAYQEDSERKAGKIEVEIYLR